MLLAQNGGSRSCDKFSRSRGRIGLLNRHRFFKARLSIAEKSRDCGISNFGLPDRIQNDHTVLELGSGAAIQIMAPLATQGRVFGIDNSPEMLAQASRRNRRAIARGIVEFRQGSFTKLPWEDKTIDKILAIITPVLVWKA